MSTKSKKSVRWLAVLMLVAASLSFTQGLYIQAKAIVAQWLLADAWEQTLHGDDQVKPWSWAGIWPVASLRVNSQKLPDGLFSFPNNLLVLNQASGQGLAFGPGQLHSSVSPGAPGWLIIGGHRDTHFSFLEHISLGEKIELQATDGHWHVYEVDDIQVVDSLNQSLPAADAIIDAGLILVTCYPFDVVSTGGSLRYVVRAKGQVL